MDGDAGNLSFITLSNAPVPGNYADHAINYVVHAARSTEVATVDGLLMIYQSKVGLDYRIEHFPNQIESDGHGQISHYLKKK